MPFDLGINEWLGNCVFCPKKSDLKLGAASRDEPEMLSGFLSALNDGSVRVGEGTGNADQMCRGKRSLEALISQFDGIDTAKIKQRIRGSHMEDSGSCSESCEVFLSDE